MRITDAVVRVRETGKTVKADCFGNNASIECPRCNVYPILLIALPNQRGSGIENPAVCRNCGCRLSIAEFPGVEQIEVLDIVIH